MHANGSLPSYQRIFGDLDFQDSDEARSVYSPAAYLADLLQLLTGADLDARRPGLRALPLDGSNTATELPYLDVVNEILAAAVDSGGDAEHVLTALRHPFTLPFSLRQTRLRRVLHHLGISPLQLYRQFARQPSADLVACEYLELTPDEVTLYTTVLDADALRAHYGLDPKADDPYPALAAVTRFRQAASLTFDDLQALLTARFVHSGDEIVTIDEDGTRLVREPAVAGDPVLPVPVSWFERASRFVRVARRLDLSFQELDLVLRACCGGRIDAAALRRIAALRYLQRGLDVPLEAVVALVAAVGPAHAAAAPLADADVRAVVERYRARSVDGVSGPLDRGPAAAGAQTVLHRISRLSTALDVTVPELFDVLDAVDSDPSLRRHPALPILLDPAGATGTTTPAAQDSYLLLADGTGGDEATVDARLWLVQTVLTVAGWMRSTGLDSATLLDVVGVGPRRRGPASAAEHAALLDSLRTQFEPVRLAPDAVQSDRFGARAAQVISDLVAVDGVVSPRDRRILRTTPRAVREAAYAAVAALGEVRVDDLVGLGLGDRLAAKIYTNLVLHGYLDPSGTIQPGLLPPAAGDLLLTGRFGDYRDVIFTGIAQRCAAAAGDASGDPPALSLSDLAIFDQLGMAEQIELYDNLIFRGHLDADGVIRDPAFFADPAHAALFGVDAELADLVEPVHARLRELVEQFPATGVAVDASMFANVALPGELHPVIVDSLRFNGWLDGDGVVIDPLRLLDLTPAQLTLDATLHPHRREILDAVQGQLLAAWAATATLGPDTFADLADLAAARRAAGVLVAELLDAGRVPDAVVAELTDPVAVLTLDGCTDAESQAILGRLVQVVADAAPYRLDPGALDALGLSPEQRDDVLRQLIDNGELTAQLSVPADRLAWFCHPHHVIDFLLPDLVDYSADVFGLLHTVALATDAAVDEVVAALGVREAAQHTAVFAALQDVLGVPATTAEAICAAVLGSATDTLDLLLAPALADPVAAVADPTVRRAIRRIRGFGILAAGLGLGADEVTLAFHDQDLTGKFAEPLTLPPGVDRIDALLEAPDGEVYLFRERGFWRYRPGADLPVDARPRALAELSEHFAALAVVDAAFTDLDGASWLVGRDDAGASRTFVRSAGHTAWTPRAQVWGAVRSTFDGTGIDAAFVDDQGRVYLFRGDQYVRYTGADHSVVDEGYPRRIGDWWAGDQRPDEVPLPPRFRSKLDAAFRGLDGVTYLFAGDQVVAVGRPTFPADQPDAERAELVEQPIAETWGKVVNQVATAERIDAAYIDGSALHVLVGDQVLRFSDSIDDEDVHADSGFPRRLATFFSGLPGGFESGVEAAFADRDGAVHLFKQGRTVTLNAGTGELVPTAQRWGVLGPVLAGNRVDAALLGLDGRTYLFSDTQYVRYSDAAYTLVDPGYPRRIDADWGGLCQVGASFVLDGATYLFGTPGKLFDLPLDQGPRTAWSRDLLAPVHHADLDAGRLPGVLRDKLTRHAIRVPADAVITSESAGWRLDAEDGLRLSLRRAGSRLEVHVAPPETDDGEEPYWAQRRRQMFYVKYSTRDYTTPDADYPRPLGENWWNLPTDLVGADATFALIDAVFTAADGRIHLFAGEQFIVFDAQRRWWSAPRPIADGWAGLPFRQVDAAFVGADGRTYVFQRDQVTRYTSTYTRVDDRYPAPITTQWGIVDNAIVRTGRVDAALVVERPEMVDAAPVGDGSLDTPEPAPGGRIVRRTYLFSGGQFIRYTHRADGTRPAVVDLGYPQRLAALRSEPGFANLDIELDRVDAASADRGSIYLFSGRDCHVLTDRPYRRHGDLARAEVLAALVEDGTVHFEHPDGWYRYSALEGIGMAAEPAQPRTLRTVPAEFRTSLDAVLAGTDGTTYLFQGPTCYNTTLERAYPLAEEWGRPRHNIYHDNTVDAAFVATDGRTYVFSGDQFVVYDGMAYAGAEVAEGPLPIAEHFAGLTRVTLAYVRAGVTHLFGPPDAAGHRPLVVYSGKEFDRPDDGYPATVDAEFWVVPPAYRPAGFTGPDAVLFTGDAMLLLTGGTVVQYDEVDRVWAAPRPLERIWRGIGSVDRFSTAFTGRDGATYFFFGPEFARYSGRTFAARQSVRQYWGNTRNPFLTGAGDDVIDAAFVHRGVTYLFAGDQYVRYSTSDYRFADPGYPRPVTGNLRHEEPFAALPPAVEDELVQRLSTGSRSVVDAVVVNDRHTYVFAGRTCHAVSAEPAATYDIAVLGRVRNNLVDKARVDAALVSGVHTYLFSGDQFVRYTGDDYRHVDEGYPQTIADGLAAELGVTGGLPPALHAGIDAAVRTADGVQLFAGNQCFRVVGDTVLATTIADSWGGPRNDFLPGGLRAAFVAPSGQLYAFAGDQCVRYQPPLPGTAAYAHVDAGSLRRVHDNWGALPDTFETGIDGAFTLRGNTYLCRDEQYVRYSGEQYDRVARTFPQPLADRFTDTADYRLADLSVITRYVALARTHRAAGVDLAALLSPAAGPAADPYREIAAGFGWDVEQLRWCRRNGALFSDSAAGADRIELEFLLELVDLFAFTEPLGSTPSRLYADVWVPLFTGRRPGDPELDAATATLTGLLERQAGAQRWPALSRTLHDELAVALRDALVAALLGPEPGSTSRDLSERFLIDVDMGADANTSRVREAIAAAQLYVHRYLLSLEPADGGQEQHDQVKQWWTWMRNYRVWEANRKVFLYPENYLRPELRDTKTPAFASLEQDLLQSEITAPSVELAYKRYLDEYTEVSRLTIAGGYVYTKDRLPDGPRRLVLFGRTKTDPRRYYHRRAEFGSREKLSAVWEPWQPVNVGIEADLVHPVHAFGRVFVFWTTVEPVAAGQPGTRPAVHDGQPPADPKAAVNRVRISYSFCNLAGEWVPAQLLGVSDAEAGTIGDIELTVLPRADAGRTSVAVACAYSVTPPAPAAPKPYSGGALFVLNPELYAERLRLPATGPDEQLVSEISEAVTVAATAKAATADRVSSIFVDPVAASDVIRFDAPASAESWPWFSVDVKGGSFLCRPVTVEPAPVTSTPLQNDDRMPDWTHVDAAAQLPGGSRLLFDNTGLRSVTIPATGDPLIEAKTRTRWGLRRTVLPVPDTAVDAILVRGQHTFVFYGEQYVRFTGTPFGRIDDEYPKALAGNTEGLPTTWERVDVALTLPDRAEVFFNRAGQLVVGNGRAVSAPIQWSDLWLRQRFDKVNPPTIRTAMLTKDHLFVFTADSYLRITLGKPTPSGKHWYEVVDRTYPMGIQDNPDGIPTDLTIDAAVWRDGTAYYFDNTARRYAAVSPTGEVTYHPVHRTPTAIAGSGKVDAAWVGTAADGVSTLYLTNGGQFVRYTLTGPDTVPDFIDEDTGAAPGILDATAISTSIDTVLPRGTDVYLFSGAQYTKMPATQDPSTIPPMRPIAGAWGELPSAETPPFDAALQGADGLMLFVDDGYLWYAADLTPPRPYELSTLPFEIIRLTTATAADLNRRLLSGGMPALLDLSTQEIDEVRISVVEEDRDAVRVDAEMVDVERLPSGTHLDFRSANGLYYWEIFFHAPLLIAQALNTAQRFEDARRWYEYLFDPTNTGSYWRFLPFLTLDPAGLADSIDGELAAAKQAKLGVDALGGPLGELTAALRTLAPAIDRSPATDAEKAAFDVVTSADKQQSIATAVTALTANLPPAADAAAAAARVAQLEAADRLRERTQLAAGTGALFQARGDEDDLLRVYRGDPFDPHAIAALRPVAYRRAVVMAYVDNLLDWADMLFRQYTPESVDEARMLYVLAYDLLGDRPERLGVRLLPAAQSLAGLDTADLRGYFTRGGALLTGPGEVHAGVGAAYFTIPDNRAFHEYWTRVEDRLSKIRMSLDILGTSRPLPLFAPALDPMALVRSVAEGAGIDAVVAGSAAPPPHYRFAAVYRRAQDAADRLSSLGGELLGALESGNAEELSILHQRHEQDILLLTRAVNEARVRIAEQGVAELTVARAGAVQRAGHYDGLITAGMNVLERSQLSSMSDSVNLFISSAALQIGAGIAHAVPQIKAGPFIFGTEAGGIQVGAALDAGAEFTQTLAEAVQVIGESLGVRAQYQRMVEDWQLQADTAHNDVEQTTHRLAAAEQELAVARRELELLGRQIEQNAAVTTFLREKFTNAELYNWMTTRLSGLYFQAYHLAHDLAKAAERAWQFEQGAPDTEATYIRATYWESRRTGLLAGQSLALDLQRLGKAQFDNDARSLEITRQVSLLATDPTALIRLRNDGRTDFTLTEALFDRDFPGHYRRQIRTVSVTFIDSQGQPVGVNATLTQQGNKTVLAPDPAAVGHLLDPKGAPPQTIRADWRASQRIALSQVEYGRDNNGLFELRYDDERYLPFEGTGAVSTWRLERAMHGFDGVYDVVVTVKYTAAHGGDAFAAAVKAMLRPYPATRFVDVAQEFPEQWEDFVANGADRLVLPMVPAMLPNLAGRRVTGILATYDVAGETPARLVLDGDPALTLTEATLLPTPALTVGEWSFALDGDKADLQNVGLVLTYQALVP